MEEKVLSEILKSNKWLEDEVDVLKRGFGDLKTSERAVSSPTGRVVLDVGGTKFTTTISTLRSKPGSFFDVLFSGHWKLQREVDGSIFIDRSPCVFEYVLNFLRGVKIDFDSLSDKETEMLREDARFYQITDLLTLIKESEIESEILDQDEILKLLKWFPGKKKLSLLYRGTRDGFTASSFHDKCDFKEQTIVIILDTHKCVFGGYAPLPWDRSGVEKYDPRAFLFYASNGTLIRLNQVPLDRTDKESTTTTTTATKCKQIHSILCHGIFGPVFGCGEDLLIVNQCNKVKSNRANSDHYETPFTESGYLCRRGKSFKVAEIEVFEV